MRLSVSARVGIWAVLICMLGLTAFARLDRAHPVQTDLLALLPKESAAPLVERAIERNRDAFARQVLVLISGPESAHIGTLAEAVRAVLARHGLSPASAASVNALIAIYREHRYALLPEDQSASLTPSRLAAKTAANLGSPSALLFPPAVDPGGDLSRFVAALPRPYAGFTPTAGIYVKRGASQDDALLPLVLAESGFSEAGPREVVRGLAEARDMVRARCGSCELEATGAPLFAAAAQSEGKREISILSSLSLLIIGVLLLAVFRSLRPLVMAALCAVSATFAAAALVICVYGSIHLITLVCGTTLLGISVDYAFHYLAEARFGRAADGMAAMRAIRPGLQLGLITSVLAFAFLLGAGFPALTQIALFSGGGLVVAYLTVELLFPVLDSKRVGGMDSGKLKSLELRGVWRWLVPLLLVLGAGSGWIRLQINDGVRELQNFPSALIRTDSGIRARIGQPVASGFFLTSAPDLKTALARESKLRAQLPAIIGLSRFLPPGSDQAASLQAWRTVFADADMLARAFRKDGLPASIARASQDAWRKTDNVILEPATLFAAVPGLEQFTVKADGRVGLMALPPPGSGDEASLRKLAQSVSGVRFISPIHHLSSMFAKIRRHAEAWVAIGYVFIALLLLLRYGWKGAARVMLPPVLSVMAALGLLGWVGVAVNVFVVMALILVLGIGVDYTIFLRETRDDATATRVAVFMSSVTTTGAFGLLAMSSIPALHAFGLTILVGIVVAFFTAPLAVEREA